MKDEVRILFGHGAEVGNVVAHDGVEECVVGCWTMRQMTNDQTIYSTLQTPSTAEHTEHRSDNDSHMSY